MNAIDVFGPPAFALAVSRALPGWFRRVCGVRAAGLALLVSAGASFAGAQTVLTGELLTNPGAESGLTGWTQGTGPHTFADNGTYDPGYTPHSGGFDFVAGASSVTTAGSTTATFFQTVSLSTLSSAVLGQIDTGSALARLSFWENSYNQGTNSDTAQVVLTFRDANNSLLGTASSAVMMSINAWAQYQNDFVLPVGTRSIGYTIVSQMGSNGGSYIDAFVDDNSLVLAAVPEPPLVAVLTGAVALAGALAARQRWPRAKAAVSAATAGAGFAG